MSREHTATAVLCHGPYKGVDVYNTQRDAAFPWGTKKTADETVTVDDLANFKIALKKHAPNGWKGKAHISFIMQNTGPRTRAKIILR